jgi:hypothetical protein
MQKFYKEVAQKEPPSTRQLKFNLVIEISYFYRVPIG